MEQVAQSFATTYGSLLGWSLSWWTDTGGWGLPQLRDQTAPLIPVSRWLAAAVLATGLVCAAAVILVRRRGEDLAAALLAVARVLLTVSAGWLVLASTWSLGHHLARWILGGSPGVGAYRAEVERAVAASDPVLGVILSIVGIACGLAFVSAVIVRFVIAAVLVVGLPVVAAGSLLGAVAFRRAVAWLAAVVLFEPLTAVVYRIGHTLVLHSAAPILVLLITAVTSFLAAGMLPAAARLTGARS